MIRQMGNQPYKISVYRQRKWIKIDTTDILPGDLCSVLRATDNNPLPCDMLLLRGQCIVDESMLTGESIPQMKVGRTNERTNGKQRTSPMIIYCISLTYWIVVHWWQKQLSQWGDVLFFVSSRTPLTSSSSSSPVGTHRKCRWTNSLRSRTSRQIARSLRRNKDRSTYTTGESTRRNERYFDNPRLYCSTSETSSV